MFCCLVLDIVLVFCVFEFVCLGILFLVYRGLIVL